MCKNIERCQCIKFAIRQFSEQKTYRAIGKGPNCNFSEKYNYKRESIPFKKKKKQRECEV